MQSLQLRALVHGFAEALQADLCVTITPMSLAPGVFPMPPVLSREAAGTFASALDIPRSYLVFRWEDQCYAVGEL